MTEFDAELVKDAPLTFGREFYRGGELGGLRLLRAAVGPVAEEAGREDGAAPARPAGGVDRRRAADPAQLRGFKRVLEIAAVPNVGLNFCVGTWARWAPTSTRRYGTSASARGSSWCHFRNVIGTVPQFRESFINSGDVDIYRAMKLFKELGFEGVFTDDHVPKLIDDTDWGHRSHAYAMGYIQACWTWSSSDGATAASAAARSWRSRSRSRRPSAPRPTCRPACPAPICSSAIRTAG